MSAYIAVHAGPALEGALWCDWVNGIALLRMAEAADPTDLPDLTSQYRWEPVEIYVNRRERVL